MTLCTFQTGVGLRLRGVSSCDARGSLFSGTQQTIHAHHTNQPEQKPTLFGVLTHPLPCRDFSFLLGSMMRENAATMRSCIVEAELSPDLKRVFEIAWSRIASNDKLKEALIKYDRL